MGVEILKVCPPGGPIRLVAADPPAGKEPRLTSCVKVGAKFALTPLVRDRCEGPISARRLQL